MRKFAGPLFFMLALFSLPSPILAQCGVERWSVKTGTDADVGLVNLSSSTAQTIATMRSWTAPSPIPANNRVSPYETTQWVLNATLTQYKLESDSDYHLILQDGSGNTMIAEIPSPSCVGGSSPFGPGITTARNQFDARYTATSSFQTANVPVQIKGVGMFDFLHGQTGVAPNGIEIHAVLNIIFNPGTADFAISAAPSALSVVQGTSGTSTISTSVSGGFNSAISLSASGLPTGASASFSPTSIAAPGSGSSTATITAGAATPAGTYTVTITGTGGGITHTTSVTLTVTSSATPDFTISASPPSLSVVQGASGSSTVTTTVSGGFNAAVALSSSGAPAGTTVTFAPTSIAAPGNGSSTMTMAVGASTAVGTYTITITGTGGTKTHTATVSLTVTAPTGGALVNGTFETGTLSGWTTTGTAAVNTAAKHSGTYGAQLGSTAPSTDSTLAQTFTLPSNASTLSFWYANTCPDTLTYDWVTATLKDNVTGTTTTVLAKTCTTTALWSQVSTNVASNAGHSMTLTITNHDDNYAGDATFTYVDDVVVATGVVDTTPPTTSITAPANGATVSATVSVTASATDNVGVTRVEFYLDGTLKSTSTTSPYTWSWDTTTATNASHSLVSKAYDAAGNVGTSATITVTVSNGGSITQLLGNPGFETGTASPWVAASGVVTNSASQAAHSGTWKAWLDGYGTAHTDTLYQQVAIPSTVTTATLTFWLHIDTAETSTTTVYDTLNVQVRNSSGTVLATLTTYSNLNATTGYVQKTFDLSAYKGQTVQVYLIGVEDGSYQTSFVVDDFALNVQ